MVMAKDWIDRIPIAGACGLALLLAACATTSPESESALDQARGAVQRLEADPLAAQTAGQSLQEARNALAAAESAERQHKSTDEVVHLSYLARREADIGEAVIAEHRADNAMAQAQSQREHVLLEAREHEAAQARAQAAQAQQAAQESQQQAQQSQQQAQASQQQAQASEQQAQASQQQAAQAKQQLEDMQAKETARGMMLTLGNVLFDTAGDTLKPGADEMIGRLSQFLQNYPNIKIRIEGYTDSRGSDSYNQALGQRRAEAVATALEGRGIDASRIQAVSRGKSAPVASNDTPAGRQQNRRVEIIFSDSKGQFLSG
ncbi:MAG TPA: OmpA family protein [Steroidobacteraceae bacterium]